MKKLVVLLFVLFSSVASASCYERLLDGFRVESNTFQIYDEEADMNFHESPEAVSLGLIKKLEDQLVCEEGSIKIENIHCSQIAPNIPLSLSCYGESQDGYFFINNDMMGNFNIIFNRFD